MNISRSETSLIGGEGTIEIAFPNTNPDGPLAGGETARVAFRPFGTNGFTVGSDRTAALLDEVGARDYFSAGHDDRLLVVFRVGADASNVCPGVTG